MNTQKAQLRVQVPVVSPEQELGVTTKNKQHTDRLMQVMGGKYSGEECHQGTSAESSTVMESTEPLVNDEKERESEGSIRAAKPPQQCTSCTPQRTSKLPPTPPPTRVPKPDTTAKVSSLVSALQRLLAHTEKLYKPGLSFEVTNEAAATNYHKLQEVGFSLDKLVNGGEKSVLTLGSEFKPVRELEKLLGRHPRWAAMKKILQEGADFPVDAISEADRIKDLVGRLQRGNHKSAQKHGEFLSEALRKEILKGWLLPLPASEALTIPELEMAPLGVAVHNGISADGSYIEKERVTHDLSFPGCATGESINSRIREGELEPCLFGHMMQRLIHYILRIRQEFPSTVIWMRKEDFKSAYCRFT